MSLLSVIRLSQPTMKMAYTTWAFLTFFSSPTPFFGNVEQEVESSALSGFAQMCGQKLCITEEGLKNQRLIGVLKFWAHECSNRSPKSVVVSYRHSCQKKIDAGWSGRQTFGGLGFSVREEDGCRFFLKQCAYLIWRRPRFVRISFEQRRVCLSGEW